MGWDFATGIDTVNAYNLVMAFPTTGPMPTPTATPTPCSSVLKVRPNSLNLKSAPVGRTKVKSVNLQNATKRGVPITVSNATITESESNFDFPPGASNCPQQLAAKQKCALSVQFQPQ